MFNGFGFPRVYDGVLVVAVVVVDVVNRIIVIAVFF